MISPRYMICSEGRIVDRDTGLISHINVIDKFLIPRSQGRPGPVLLRFFVSAVWETDEELPLEEECEWEMVASFPGENEPRTMGSGRFRFTLPFQRFDILFQTVHGDASLAEIRLQRGVIRFTSRVRRLGDTEWLSQEYGIPLDVVSAEQPNERAPERIESN